MLVALFAHTDQGSKALREVLATGVPSEAIRVIGDLGIPAGQAGAMHHGTLDTLHIPVQQRGLFMEGIRQGGVVLAVTTDFQGVEQILHRHGATLVEQTAAAQANPSHNAAG